MNDLLKYWHYTEKMSDLTSVQLISGAYQQSKFPTCLSPSVDKIILHSNYNPTILLHIAKVSQASLGNNNLASKHSLSLRNSHDESSEKNETETNADTQTSIPISSQVSTFLLGVDLLINIQVLNLGYNNIGSIECISSMRMPQLRQLHLFKNNLGTIWSLRKANLPKLEYLNIVENQVIELAGLEQGHFPALTQIWAYDNQVIDGRKLVKVECPVEACLVGMPDHIETLQMQLHFRCELYYPDEIDIFQKLEYYEQLRLYRKFSQ